LLTFTHVREVVAAHIAAADKGQNGGSYLLGGENKTMMELVKEISTLVGKPAPQKETSLALLRVVAVVGDLASRFTGKEPPITPEMASLMSRKVSTSSEKAHRELGYRVVPLKDMVKDCYDWMVAEGRI
jgi:dihydroflavonol-4-reductase